MNNRKKIKTGTLGKLSRRVRRNQERAMKARGKREKAMCEKAFQLGVDMGGRAARYKFLNATANLSYEEEPIVQTSCSDPESDGVLSTPVDLPTVEAVSVGGEVPYAPPTFPSEYSQPPVAGSAY